MSVSGGVTGSPGCERLANEKHRVDEGWVGVSRWIRVPQASEDPLWEERATESLGTSEEDLDTGISKNPIGKK